MHPHGSLPPSAPPSACPFLMEQQQQRHERTQQHNYTRQHTSGELPPTLTPSSSQVSFTEHSSGRQSSTAPSWLTKRPRLYVKEHLRRRELRKLNRQWTLDEVAEHRYVDDIWIVVDGRVYDITEHLVSHPGWSTAAVSTPLSIFAHGGMDCSQEFHELHRPYPIAYKQLPAFYIGDLAETQRR